MDETLVKQYKKHKEKLADIYSELLVIFHESRHYSVSKNIHVSIFEIDRAIKDLDSALGDL